MLKDYLAHSNMLALEIKDLNEEIAIHKKPIRPWVAHFLLSRTMYLADLLARLEKYINMEEVEMAWW